MNKIHPVHCVPIQFYHPADVSGLKADIILVDDAAWASLGERVHSSDGQSLLVAGIPVERIEQRSSRLLRAWELQARGKRVAVVSVSHAH